MRRRSQLLTSLSDGGKRLHHAPLVDILVLHAHGALCSSRSAQSLCTSQPVIRVEPNTLALHRLEDSKQAKRQRVDIPAGEGRAYLPAPEGMAVGPAHLVRQHGLPPRTAEPPPDAASAPAAHAARPATASWHRTAGASATAAAMPVGSAKAAAGLSHSSNAERVKQPEPAAAAPAPRRTLADLAKQSRLAASRGGGGAAADPAARVPLAVPMAESAQAVGSRQPGADGAVEESVPAKRPPEEDLAVYVRRLKAELPPAAHAAVLGHLAAYRRGPATQLVLMVLWF